MFYLLCAFTVKSFRHIFFPQMSATALNVFKTKAYSIQEQSNPVSQNLHLYCTKWFWQKKTETEKKVRYLRKIFTWTVAWASLSPFFATHLQIPALSTLAWYMVRVDVVSSLRLTKMSCLLGRIFSPLGAYQSMSLASPNTERKKMKNGATKQKSSSRKSVCSFATSHQRCSASCFVRHLDLKPQPLFAYNLEAAPICSECIICSHSNYVFTYIPNVSHHRCSTSLTFFRQDSFFCMKACE